MAKPEREFSPVTDAAWTRSVGTVDGIDKRILARDADTGMETTIERYAPGTDTTPSGVQVHDFWEEVYILEGSLHDLTLNQTFHQGDYACRPPGMPHGPWRSGDGCVMFVCRYRART